MGEPIAASLGTDGLQLLPFSPQTQLEILIVSINLGLFTLSQNNLDLLDVTMVCDDCAKQVVGDGQTHGQTISLGPKYCFPGTQIQFPRDPNTVSQGPTTTTDAGDMLLLMFCPLLSGSHCNVRISDSIWKETWNFMFAGNLKSYLKLSGRTRTLRVT